MSPLWLATSDVSSNVLETLTYLCPPGILTGEKPSPGVINGILYNMWPPVSGFFHMMLLRFIYLQPERSLLWLNSSLLCGKTAFCVSFRQLMDLWVVSTLGLL